MLGDFFLESRLVYDTCGRIWPIFLMTLCSRCPQLDHLVDGVNLFTGENFIISFSKYALQTLTIQLPIIVVLHFSDLFFSKSTDDYSMYSKAKVKHINNYKEHYN